MTNRALPGAVSQLSGMSAIAAGSLFTIALRSDGTVWAFGTNWNEIVPGEARRIIPEPVQVRALTGIEAIAVQQDRGYARDRQGRIWVWGKSEETQADSAPRELSTGEVAGLSGRLASQLFPGDQTPALEGKWAGHLVRVADSAIEVKGTQAGRYDLEGSVIDVDWGWSVVLITAPFGSEAAVAAKAPLSKSPLSQSMDKRRAAGSLAGLGFHRRKPGGCRSFALHAVGRADTWSCPQSEWDGMWCGGQ